jgi:folate-dependent phosphoribosylglycinamide formyltransferase PurN
MRIVVHGQQAFGKAVLEALIARGETVVGVYVAPEKPGAKPDPLKETALALKLPVFQPASYRKPEVCEEFRKLTPDLQVMAFVTLFVPEEFLNMPTHGSIQYHPSLLPRYRGPSAINWPIINGDDETGLSIFWPDNGLDTGDVLLQKKTPIGLEDSLGSVYFDRLFPMGVEAMLEAVDLVKAGKAPRFKQDEALATYEGRALAAGPQPHPRLQSRARRLDETWRSDAADFRGEADSCEIAERHRRQDGRDRRGRCRGVHRGLRRWAHQGASRQTGRRRQGEGRRMGERFGPCGRRKIGVRR